MLGFGNNRCLATYPKKHPYPSLSISFTNSSKYCADSFGSYLAHFKFARCQYNFQSFLLATYVSLAIGYFPNSFGLFHNGRTS